MKIYKINENSHKVIVNGKEQYVSDGFSNAEEITFEDLESMGLHFTPQRNSPSISVTGLRPQIGSNSSGALGREAIEKTFFSNGIDGAMQIFNRTINVMGEIDLKSLQNDKEKREHLTVLQRNSPKTNESLSIIEAFEYARRYMEDNRYFAFDLVEPTYERQIDEEQIDSQVASINSRLDNITGITVSSSAFTKEDIQRILETVYANIENLKEKSLKLDEKLKSQLVRWRNSNNTRELEFRRKENTRRNRKKED